MRKYVLQAMGMESSKYGGLEKFIVLLAEYLNSKNIGLIVLYNTRPWSEEYINDLDKTGVKLVISHAMKPLKYLQTLLRIYRQYKPDIVQTHFQNYYSIFFSRLIGCRKVYAFIHGMIIDENLYFIHDKRQLKPRKRVQKQIIFGLATRIMAVSDAAREQYVSLFPGLLSKTETFYLGVFPNLNVVEYSRKGFNLPLNSILIGTIGFNSPVKGLDILFDAFSILKTEYQCKELVLIHIGIDISDPSNEHFQIDAKKKGIDENIIWLGIRNDVVEVLPCLDIYCQPSRSEALPLSIMEAGMAGLPLVGSRVGGIPEIIEEGTNGFLFESENARALSEKLIELIKDEELRKQMGDNSKETILKKFNIFHQAEKLASMYAKECLPKNGD